MSHFYDCESEPVLLPEVTTPAKARKAGPEVYPSVTTVLGIMSDPFLDSIWKPREITRIARELPDLEWQEVSQLTYGTRDHPASGEKIPSSEFGTAVHKAIEVMLNGDELDPETAPFYGWAVPFIDFVDEMDWGTFASEMTVYSRTLRVAGTVDYIGIKPDGSMVLCDYKCRRGCEDKAKVYDKDLYQLAIEAQILFEAGATETMPECRTVVIDFESKQHHHHVWSVDKVYNGIEIAKLCAKLYHAVRMR